MRVCPYRKCDGSGLAYDPVSRQIVDCECRPALIFSGATAKAEIRNEYLEADLGSVITDQGAEDQNHVAKTVKDYSANWEQNKAAGLGLAILGNRKSLGKSYLASAICMDLIRRFWTESIADQDVCLFVNVSNWFRDWEAWATLYGTTEQERKRDDYEETGPGILRKRFLATREERMKTTGLLVLDDISLFNITPKRLVKLYDVVERRVSDLKPIIVTDNHPSWAQTAAALGGTVGPMIVDRLRRSMTETLIMGAPLRRPRAAKK